jgi:hypothetical protein
MFLWDAVRDAAVRDAKARRDKPERIRASSSGSWVPVVMLETPRRDRRAGIGKSLAGPKGTAVPAECVFVGPPVKRA